jgi:hypothetical protein
MRRAQLIGLAVIVVASGPWATPAAGQVVFLPTPPRIGVAARKTPSRICTEPGQALDGTSCEVQTWTNTNNTVGQQSPEELSVAGLLGRTGDT